MELQSNERYFLVERHTYYKIYNLKKLANLIFKRTNDVYTDVEITYKYFV